MTRAAAHRGDARVRAAAAAAAAAAAGGRGRARVGDDGGDDEREAGFGMTRARVMHARVSDARDDAGDGVRRRVIEATRARRAAAAAPPLPPPPRRARVGDHRGKREGSGGSG